MRKDRRDKEIQNDQISSERKGIKSEKEYNREQMNKGDMHNTKKIENKNDGIEEKIFTNSKKDRMEKKVQKKHTHTKKS